MVTKKRVVRSLVPAEDQHIVHEALRDFGKRNMTTYAIAVNLDRSVPDLYDGMKPVQRRVAWGLNQMASGLNGAGEAVGLVLGRFHAHGDCLDGDTLVYTLDGKITPIRDMLNKGKKWVLAFDPKTKTLVPALAHSWRIGQHTKTTFELQLSDGSSVEATGNHPFYVRNQGWVKTEDIRVGDEFIGGSLRKDLYLNVRSSSVPNGAVHSAVSLFTNGDSEAGEVVHHENENRWDNRPKNLKLIDRAEHQAEHLDNAIVGLRNGNVTMKSRKYRRAIRKKNSSLMSTYNEWQWLAKALKIVRAVMSAGLDLNEATYNQYRPLTYNATKWSSLQRKGLDASDLVLMTETWSLPTEEATGHTKKLRQAARKARPARVAVTAPLVAGKKLRLFMKVIRKMRYYKGFPDLTWSDYNQARKDLASLGTGLGNIHKRNFPKVSTLAAEFGKTQIKSLIAKASPVHGLFVTGISVLKHLEKKPMYDFTVDGFENMVIVTKDDADQATFVVAHNSSVYGAMVTMVHMPTPVIFGKGNWGTMTDGAAAYRYTSTMLTGYGRSFFDSDYINDQVTSFIPNYNDKYVEPVTLPAQLPNVLLNGGEGIGVGITTHLPTFSPVSVITVLERLLKGEQLKSIDFARTLKYQHKWGGSLVKSKENSQQWLSMFRGSSANVQFESTLHIERDNKRITIDDWPPGTNLEAFVRKVRAMPECQSCINSKGSATYTIQCKTAYNYAQFDKFADKVQVATRQRRAFKINVTQRTATTKDGIVSFKTEFLALSIPRLLILWLKERIAVEQRSLAYRVQKVNEDIDYSQTMILVGSNTDRIIKIIRSSDDPEHALVKQLKLKPHQAKWICDLQLRKISKLDQAQYKSKLKEQQTVLKQLLIWKKRPKTKVLLDLARMREVVGRDLAYQHKEDTQELTII